MGVAALLRHAAAVAVVVGRSVPAGLGWLVLGLLWPPVAQLLLAQAVRHWSVCCAWGLLSGLLVGPCRGCAFRQRLCLGFRRVGWGSSAHACVSCLGRVSIVAVVSAAAVVSMQRGGEQCCPCDPEGSPRRRIWACQSLLRAVLSCMVAVGAAVVVVVEVSVVCLGSPRLLLGPGRRAVPMGPLPGRMVPGSRVCVGTAVAGSVGGDRQVSPLGVVGVGGGRSHQVATVVLVGLPAGLERLAVLAGSVRPLVLPVESLAGARRCWRSAIGRSVPSAGCGLRAELAAVAGSVPVAGERRCPRSATTVAVALGVGLAAMSSAWVVVPEAGSRHSVEGYVLPAVVVLSGLPLVTMAAALGLRCGALLERLCCSRQQGFPRSLVLSVGLVIASTACHHTPCADTGHVTSCTLCIPLQNVSVLSLHSSAGSVGRL